MEKIIYVNQSPRISESHVRLNNRPPKTQTNVKPMSIIYQVVDPSYYVRGNTADLVFVKREHIFEFNKHSIVLQLVEDYNVNRFYITITTSVKQRVQYCKSEVNANDVYRSVFLNIEKRILFEKNKTQQYSISKEDIAMAKKIDENLEPIGFKRQYQLDLARVKATKNRLARRRLLKIRLENKSKPVLKRTFHSCVEINKKVVQFKSEVYKICNMTYKLVITGGYQMEKIFRTERDAVNYITKFGDQIKFKVKA